MSKVISVAILINYLDARSEKILISNGSASIDGSKPFKTVLTFLRKNILLLLIFYTASSIPSSATLSDIDADVQYGLNEVYNLKFDDAEKRFIRIQKDYSADPKGYFYESLLYFYKAIATRNEIDYQKFIDQSDGVISKCEDLLDTNPGNYDAMYYLGLSKSYRSLLMLSLNKSLLQAASDGNSGYRILSSLVESNPKYFDAYMGLGLYRIAIGFVPEKFRWLLSLIGFKGDIKEGKKYLLIASQKGQFTKIDSKVFLSIFSLNEKEDDDRQSLKLSKELVDEFPGSPFFKILYASILLQYGLMPDAIAVSEDALNINGNSFTNEIKKSAAAIIGSAYFRQNKFSEAIPYFEEFSKYVLPQDRCNVYFFLLGLCYDIDNDRTRAINSYRKVRDNFINERDGELDKLSFRLANQRISEPLNEIEILLIKASNLRESFELDKAIEVYESIMSNGLLQKYRGDDYELRYYFDSGLTYVYKKDDDKALERFRKCISINPVNELWLIPHAYFELGKIYSRKGDSKRSEEMFEKIFDYDDFDFESFLEMRLTNYRNK